jgi:hypothetical protein
MLNLPSATSTEETETEKTVTDRDREQPRAPSGETGVSGGEVEEERKSVMREGVEGKRGELEGRSGLGRAKVAMSSAVRHDSFYYRGKRDLV